MPDMLVKLYELPDLAPEIAAQRAAGIDIRRGIPAERHVVVDWVQREFGAHWASECNVAFARQPVACFVAVQDEKPIGFSCYEVAARGFFGPIGVSESTRGKGTGRALLIACLQAMYAEGYGYAIIGAVGPAEFYSKAVGATLIPDSVPGIYRGLLE